MTKEPNLYKFFSGHFSEKEKLHLKEYLERNPHYFEHFQKERKIYNISLLNQQAEFAIGKEPFRKNFIQKIFWNVAKVAVIFLLAFFSFYLLNDSSGDSYSKPIAYQTITVPFGQRVNLDLPDGSKVWLNAGTSIKYPVSFNDNVREVILDGEAYFEVYKNADIPFYVSAGTHKVEVLGTKFNVSVDISKNKFETALFEGSVKVFDPAFLNQSVELQPNTLLSIVEGKSQVLPITHLERFDWRKGILCFNKERFEDIMTVFEKSYNYKIRIHNKNVSKYLYTGKFLQSDGIDYALGLLQESIHFSYSREKNTNTIIIE